MARCSPVLHLNGYKIANPTVLARDPPGGAPSAAGGLRLRRRRFVEGDEPAAMHQLMAATLDEVIAEIAEIQRRAREDGETVRPRWPMIVLRTPKGWTGPEDRRWAPGGGVVSLAPGPARGPGGQPRAPGAVGGVDALLPS